MTSSLPYFLKIFHEVALLYLKGEEAYLLT
jgi:hypothetical protein